MALIHVNVANRRFERRRKRRLTCVGGNINFVTHFCFCLSPTSSSTSSSAPLRIKGRERQPKISSQIYVSRTCRYFAALMRIAYGSIGKTVRMVSVMAKRKRKLCAKRASKIEENVDGKLRPAALHSAFTKFERTNWSSHSTSHIHMHTHPRSREIATQSLQILINSYLCRSHFHRSRSYIANYLLKWCGAILRTHFHTRTLTTGIWRMPFLSYSTKF